MVIVISVISVGTFIMKSQWGIKSGDRGFHTAGALASLERNVDDGGHRPVMRLP